MLITPEYRILNRQLHATRPDYGVSGTKWAPQINELVKALDAKTVLDYGCGKGTLGLTLAHLLVLVYDPAIEGKDAPPGPADLVVCTDVLEHIEPDCLDAVFDDLKRLAVKGVFLTVATRPAHKTLADGRNAHLIQKPVKWWLPKIMDRWDLRLLNVTAGEFAAFALYEPSTTETAQAAE